MVNEFALAQGLTWPLLSSFLFFWGAGVLILRPFYGLFGAVIVVSIKSFIVLTYFSAWSDGSWFIGGDDLSYFFTGRRLLEDGHNPINVWLSPVGTHLLIDRPNVAGYHWWNMLWMYIFGVEYSVVVMANMATTFMSAIFVHKIAKELGSSDLYAISLSIFFLLHWDVLAWSSFINLKEPLVVLMMIISIWAFLKIEKRQWWAVVPLMGTLVALFGIRFYLPALLIGAAAAYLLVFSEKRLVLLPAIAFCLGVVLWKYWYTLSLVDRLAVFDIQGFAFYMVKAIWSPLPWNVTHPALYLSIPSILDLVVRPISLVGIVVLFFVNKIRPVAFIGLVILAGYVFYSLVPPLASARHLAPFNWLLIGFQFHAAWFLFNQIMQTSLSDHIPIKNRLVQIR